MDFEKVLESGFSFALNSKKLACRLGLYLIYFCILAIPAAFLISSALGAVASGSNDGISSLIPALETLALFIFILLLAAILFLLDLWARASFIQNAAEFIRGKNVGLRESFSKSKKVYLRFLVVSILVGLISTIASFVIGAFQAIPLIGLIFVVINLLAMIFFALAFAFASFEAALSEKDAFECLGASWRIFRENPLDVFLTLLLVVIFCVIAIGISMIPAMVFGVIGVALFSYSALFGVTLIALAGICLAIGISFAELFSDAALAEAYLQFNALPVVSKPLAVTAAPKPTKPRATARKVVKRAQ